MSIDTPLTMLSKLTHECKALIDASGLDGGTGGGWEQYDPTLTRLRELVGEAKTVLDKELHIEE